MNDEGHNVATRAGARGPMSRSRTCLCSGLAAAALLACGGGSSGIGTASLSVPASAGLPVRSSATKLFAGNAGGRDYFGYNVVLSSAAPGGTCTSLGENYSTGLFGAVSLYSFTLPKTGGNIPTGLYVIVPVGEAPPADGGVVANLELTSADGGFVYSGQRGSIVLGSGTSGAHLVGVIAATVDVGNIADGGIEPDVVLTGKFDSPSCLP